MARRNTPLAAADAIEWGSRRLDIAILGLFFSPAVVGIYYVAQQVASLPQKLKTSFDPILGPVITQKLAEGDKPAVAKQVRQVGFWIIAAQAGIALALGIPGEAVMGLVGEEFISGTGALGFLLAAEVVAATAAVSEAALVYIARHRNLIISTLMIGVQIAPELPLEEAYPLLQRSRGQQPLGGLLVQLGCRVELVPRLAGAAAGGAAAAKMVRMQCPPTAQMPIPRMPAFRTPSCLTKRLRSTRASFPRSPRLRAVLPMPRPTQRP